MDPKTKTKCRAILSTILIGMFVIAATLTVGVLLAAKHGLFMGFTKYQLLELKEKVGIVFLTLMFLHLLLNWDIFKKEWKILMK